MTVGSAISRNYSNWPAISIFWPIALFFRQAELGLMQALHGGKHATIFSVKAMLRWKRQEAALEASAGGFS